MIYLNNFGTGQVNMNTLHCMSNDIHNTNYKYNCIRSLIPSQMCRTLCVPSRFARRVRLHLLLSHIAMLTTALRSARKLASLQIELIAQSKDSSTRFARYRFHYARASLTTFVRLVGSLHSIKT